MEKSEKKIIKGEREKFNENVVFISKKKFYKKEQNKKKGKCFDVWFIANNYTNCNGSQKDILM